MDAALRILFISAEVAPFARTGGLGDVNGALPQVLAALGHDVRIVMPLYQSLRDGDFPLTERVSDLQVPLVIGPRTARVWQTHLPEPDGAAARVPVYAVEQDDFFARPGLYGNGNGDYPDNALRFTFFSRAVLSLVERLGWFPQVFHCHDWHTGLVPALLRFLPGLDARSRQAASVFTIHNFAYQGIFPNWAFGLTGLPPFLFQPEGLEFYGSLNFMKSGLYYADRLTTVSPSYAEEIGSPTLGFGLDGCIRARRSALVGIVNGADYAVWNPEADPLIAAQYGAEDLSGKAACKRAVLGEYGLSGEPNIPLLGMVTRLVDQKGIDLVAGALDALLELDCRLVILGSGESRYETLLTQRARAHPERIGVRIGFDEALAHQIEAGSDCFLMPSRYEPCGLSQLYSLRYGTVPIVRATGGLRDTVVPFDAGSGQGTGFVFEDASPQALTQAVRTALTAFADPAAWHGLMRRGMAQDFSWTRSAHRYLDLYQELVAARQAAVAPG